ncbi:hypothetical protein M3J09_010310 [Ascochyta lentis]
MRQSQSQQTFSGRASNAKLLQPPSSSAVDLRETTLSLHKTGSKMALTPTCTSFRGLMQASRTRRR